MPFALRSADHVEVDILGGDIVVRRAGWLAADATGVLPPPIATIVPR